MGDFFNSSQFEGGPVNGGQAGEVENSANLARVSLSQMVKLTRKEEGLVIHRQKIHAIVCIGVVLSVDEMTTKNVYMIDDYTSGSPVEIQFWRSDSDDSGRYTAPPAVMERTYVRVIGQPRYDDQKPFVVAFRIEPIVDPNDIYCHFLNVILDSLFLEKRLNATSNAVPDDRMPINGNFGQNPQSGFSEVQRSIINLLNKFSDDPAGIGLRREEIHKYLTGVGRNKIDEAIAFLVNEGHIFSTADEDTFKATNF